MTEYYYQIVLRMTQIKAGPGLVGMYRFDERITAGGYTQYCSIEIRDAVPAFKKKGQIGICWFAVTIPSNKLSASPFSTTGGEP